MSEALISLRDVDARLGHRPVLHGLCWSLCPGERWLVAGANGSGKSTFLRLLAGKIWPAPGQHARRVYGLRQPPTWSPLDAKGQIALLDPAMQNRYLRQDWNLSAGEVISTGFEDSDLVQREPTNGEYERMGQVVRRLGLDSLYRRPFLDLSQGERRRTLIARALVMRPKVLLLDEFSEGLDPAGREKLWRSLEALTEQAIVVTSHRPDPRLHLWRVLHLRDGKIAEPTSQKLAQKRRPLHSEAPGPPVVEVAGDFHAGDKFLVEGLRWTIRAGQAWFLAGANGSGKTSLLRMLWGEMHLAVGGMIRYFGERRTTPEIREFSGFFQPDLHGWIDPTEIVEDVILSGLFSSIGLMRSVGSFQRDAAAQAAVMWSCEELLPRPFGELSYGQQRRALLARATVHRPKLLLLDEPLDGLDELGRETARAALDTLRDSEMALVITTHHEDDLPAWVTCRAELREARLFTAEG